MGNRIVIMCDGVLQQVGPPQSVYERPANLFVARFIGNPPMNTITGRVVRDGAAPRIAVPGGEVPVPAAVVASLSKLDIDEVVVGVRPEHLVVGTDGPIEVTVSVVESLGHERHIFCRLADSQPLIVRQAASDAAPPEETTMRLTVDDAGLHLFDPTTEQRIGD